LASTSSINCNEQLGVFAKRSFEQYARIMVDSARNINHPAVEDLAPQNGSRIAKILLNQIHFRKTRPLLVGDFHVDDDKDDDDDDDDDDSDTDEPANEQEVAQREQKRQERHCLHVLALKVARVNHDCHPNTSCFYDPTHKVVILIANRRISCNEEIRINYVPYGILSPVRARRLERIWGIKCDAQCDCQSSSTFKATWDQIHQCDVRVTVAMAMFGSTRRAIFEKRKQLQLIDSLSPSIPVSTKLEELMEAFQIAVSSQRTLEEAKEFISKAYRLQSKIGASDSEFTVKLKKLMDNPSKSVFYLDQDFENMADFMMMTMFMRGMRIQG
jgi:hypothetical protein